MPANIWCSKCQFIRQYKNSELGSKVMGAHIFENLQHHCVVHNAWVTLRNASTSLLWIVALITPVEELMFQNRQPIIKHTYEKGLSTAPILSHEDTPFHGPCTAHYSILNLLQTHLSPKCSLKSTFHNWNYTAGNWSASDVKWKDLKQVKWPVH